MASGKKSVVINTQERAVSTDINRLQAFSAASDAELLRYWLDITGNDDLTSGLTVEHTTLESPLRAEVFGGVMVRPQIASLSLFVDPGTLMAITPDADTDASNYKFVHDPGISTLGTLVMTANSSGSTRIDVIECQVGNITSETDNRDIFNPTTGLFSATSVPKAQQDALTYRVRLGTPGAGFPGTASGWLPLAVACVPTATTTNDTITFWDVRTLITDRERGANLSRRRPLFLSGEFNASIMATAGGIVEVVGQSGRRLGGQLRRGTPGTDAATIDLTDAANSDGVAPVANEPWYLYLVTPFGLPRWSRYTDASSGARTPRNPRGIPIVSASPPNYDGNQAGTFAIPITLPASMGMAGATVTQTTGDAVCIAAGWTDVAPARQGFFGSYRDGIYLAGNATVNPILSVTGTTALPSLAHVQGGVNYPDNAKALLIGVKFTLVSGGSGVDTGDVFLQVYGPTVTVGFSAGPLLSEWRQYQQPRTVNADNYAVEFTCWVPLATTFPDLAGPGGGVGVWRQLGVLWTGSGTAASGAVFQILGWKI